MLSRAPEESTNFTQMMTVQCDKWFEKNARVTSERKTLTLLSRHKKGYRKGVSPEVLIEE